jgi:tetratricopeptide (TPR) repeat protein
MAAPAFAELVGKLVEAMGQQMDGVREVPEGLLLKTSDGFVFAFLDDPSQVSLAAIQRLFGEVQPDPARLVVLTPGRLPLALTGEILRHKATLVEAGRFHELARGLGLGTYLGDEPRADLPMTAQRLLPSAQQLDTIMQRGRTWLDWGVPALALRFYRQASQLKPEFAPARVGIGRALLGLGIIDEAERTFQELVRLHPEEVDVRLGLASVQAARGHVAEEIKIYRTLLTEDPRRVDVRTHLLAALLAQEKWGEAERELTELLKGAPEDPQLRFLHAVTLEKTGSGRAARQERELARKLGLAPERERTLSVHLGLPPPELPSSTEVPAAAASPPTIARPRAARKAPRTKVPGRTVRKRARPRKGK